MPKRNKPTRKSRPKRQTQRQRNVEAVRKQFRRLRRALTELKKEGYLFPEDPVDISTIPKRIYQRTIDRLKEISRDALRRMATGYETPSGRVISPEEGIEYQKAARAEERRNRREKARVDRERMAELRKELEREKEIREAQRPAEEWGLIPESDITGEDQLPEEDTLLHLLERFFELARMSFRGPFTSELVQWMHAQVQQLGAPTVGMALLRASEDGLAVDKPIFYRWEAMQEFIKGLSRWFPGGGVSQDLASALAQDEDYDSEWFDGY